jgi:hypothetical protein
MGFTHIQQVQFFAFIQALFYFFRSYILHKKYYR